MSAPFVYSSERSIEVHKLSEQYILDKGLDDKITEPGWIYHSIGELIPHTSENLWSGHFFPYTESWDELQISLVLCQFGLYKQAMASLRCGLELGLLSVYWNLNDDGHIVIQQWLKSQENTPRLSQIWKKFEKHHNFQEFQKLYDIRTRLLNLGFLHDYVHSKGFKFSNHLGLMKSNFQTFESIGFEKWLNTFREVVEVLSILHLIKYPLGTVKFDYDRKFGMDKPSFGGLDTFQIKRIEELLGQAVYSALQQVASLDEDVTNMQEWLDSLPDMTEQDVEDQIVNHDKMRIEHEGLENWLKNEQTMIDMLAEQGLEQSENHKERVAYLIKWAKENGFEKSVIERNQTTSPD